MREPKDWPLVAYAVFAILALIVGRIYDVLFSKWVEQFLESHGFPMTEALDALPPLLVALAVVWGLKQYLKRHYEAELAGIVQPRINFGAIKEHMEFPDSKTTLDQRHLEVQNVGKGMLDGCLVIIDKVEWEDGAMIEPHVALATVTRAREGKHGRFYLDAGSPKQILLTSRDLSDVRNPGDHTLMGEKYPVPLYRGKSGTVYLTAVAAKGDPDHLALRFSVDEMYALTFTEEN